MDLPFHFIADHNDKVFFLSIPGEELPDSLMHKIGSIRRASFLNTKNPISAELDQYDGHYHHVLVVDRETHEIITYTRLGIIRDIIPLHGSQGLYASKFFAFNNEIFHNKADVAEIGRILINPSFKKNTIALGLMWHSVSLVMDAMNINELYGLVSLPLNYQPLSLAIMVGFLERHKIDISLSQSIRSLAPPDLAPYKNTVARKLDEISGDILNLNNAIKQVEQGQRDVPTLLMNYLKMGDVHYLGCAQDKSDFETLDLLILARPTDSARHFFRTHFGSASKEPQ